MKKKSIIYILILLIIVICLLFLYGNKNISKHEKENAIYQFASEIINSSVDKEFNFRIDEEELNIQDFSSSLFNFLPFSINNSITEIIDDHLIVSGKAKILGININLQMRVKFSHDEERLITVEIDNIRLGIIHLPLKTQRYLSEKITTMLQDEFISQERLVLINNIIIRDGSLSISGDIYPLLETKNNQILLKTKIFVGQDTLGIANCVEFVGTYCIKSEINAINLTTEDYIFSNFEVDGYIALPIFSPEQDKVAFELIQGTKTYLQIYEIRDGYLKLLLNKEANLYSIGFGFEANEIITGNHDGKIEFLDIYTGDEIRSSILLQNEPVTGLVIDRGGKKIYASNYFGLLELDVSTENILVSDFNGPFHAFGKLLYHPQTEAEFTENFITLAINESNNYIASQDSNGLIIWNTVLKKSSDYIVTNLNKTEGICSTFLPSSNLILVCGEEDILYFYDYITKETISSFRKEGLSNVSVTGNGQFIILLFDDNKIIIHDRFQLNRLIESSVYINQSSYLYKVSSDNAIIGLSGSEIFYLYSADLSEQISRIEESGLVEIALNQNGNEVAMGFEDGSVKVYNYIEKRYSQKLNRENEGRVSSLIFSIDGDSIFVLYQTGCILKYDIKEEKLLWEYYTRNSSGNFIQNASISPDGKYLIFPFDTSKAYDIGILDVSGNEPKNFISNTIQDQKELDYYYDITFSVDGKYLALSTVLSKEVYIYSFLEDEIIKKIVLENIEAISSIEFINDERIAIATVSNVKNDYERSTSHLAENFSDVNIEIWDFINNKQIALLPQVHQGTISEIIRLNNDKFLSYSSNGEIYIWNTSEEQLSTIACQIAGRNLSISEMREYLGLLFNNNLCKPSNVSLIGNINEYYDKGSYLYNNLENVLGENLNLEIRYMKDYDENIQLIKPYNYEINTFSMMEELIIESVPIIQCRDNDYRMKFVDNYIFICPVVFNDDATAIITGLGGEMTASDSSGSNLQIDGSAFLLGTNEAIIIPKKLLEGYPVIGPGIGNTDINISVDTLYTEKDDFNLMEEIDISYISSYPHITFGDIYPDLNFPMHSLTLKITNESKYELTNPKILGIVYDENEKVVDILNRNSVNGNISSGNSEIITVMSLSETGRCVNQSDAKAPYKIRYWLRYIYSIDENDKYGSYSDEIIANK